MCGHWGGAGRWDAKTRNHLGCNETRSARLGVTRIGGWGGPWDGADFGANEAIGCCLRSQLTCAYLGRRFEEDTITGSGSFTLFVHDAYGAWEGLESLEISVTDRGVKKTTWNLKKWLLFRQSHAKMLKLLQKLL